MLVLFDLCINYSDFTLTSQTGANTADGHGLAKEFVVRLEGGFFFIFKKKTFYFILDCPLESGPMSKKNSLKENYQEKKAARKNMANRMRKFTGVTERYDPNTNMEKFQNKTLFK